MLLLFYYLVISLNFQEVCDINHINWLCLSEGRHVIQARKGRAKYCRECQHSQCNVPVRECSHAPPPDFVPNSISEIHLKYYKRL